MVRLYLILIITNPLHDVAIDDLRDHGERCQKMQNDSQHFLESLAVCLTSADGYVQSTENGVKDAVKRLVNELTNKNTVYYLNGFVVVEEDQGKNCFPLLLLCLAS